MKGLSNIHDYDKDNDEDKFIDGVKFQDDDFSDFGIADFDSLFDKEWSQPPSWKHPFGTTIAGYDVFSEVIHAARNNLIVSLLAISISMSIAIIIGAISGYFGGKIDTALMSFSEIFLVIPVFFFALISLTYNGSGFVSPIPLRCPTV